jgi:flavin-dependent dehydrogenase
LNEQVVVIGASSAGLFTAYLLAREGRAVRVYDQTERLAQPARTLIVTADLTRVLGFKPQPAILNRVQRFEFRSNGTLAKLGLHEPDLVVERSQLIRLLAEKATEAGADLRLGYRFSALESDGDRTLAVLRRRGSDRPERVPVSVLVGADGARSGVARAIGWRVPSTMTVLQARVELRRPVDPVLSQVWFAPQDTPYFYWLVPESSNRAAVGLVSPSQPDARRKLDRFLRHRELEPMEYQAALIPMYRPTPAPFGRLGHTNVLMVGDAAGQVKLTTVGGTVSGLAGARAAARAILHGTSYQRELWPLNVELTLHWLIRRIWNRFQEEDYSALLRSMNEQVRDVLQARSRDRWSGAVWHLLAARPHLLALAAKAAARSG